MKNINSVFRHPFFQRPTTLYGLFLLIALIAWIGKWLLSDGSGNNYLIYQGVFDHLIHQTSLYNLYPTEYFDKNHYGPFFSILVAPFSLLPNGLGCLLWLIALCALLASAIRTLPIKRETQTFIFWFSALELLTSAQNLQFNIATVAMILLSFSSIEKKNDFWAAFWIILGTFTKLYGIVGLAFFFFSKKKGRFVLSLIFWALVAFTLPMLLSSPEYIIHQYREWASTLGEKNGTNLFSASQNISLLGIVRKITLNPNYSDLWLILPGLAGFGAFFLRIRQYQYLAFRLLILAATLLFLVLFSTGTESCTYIVGVIGVCLWYKTYPKKRPWWDLALLILVFVLCELSPTDLFPRYWRETLIRPYALKALPCVLVYLRLSYEIFTADFSKYSVSNSPKS